MFNYLELDFLAFVVQLITWMMTKAMMLIWLVMMKIMALKTKTML